MSQQNVVLLLGSNLGNTKKNLELAISHIEQLGCKVLKKSDFLISEPIGFVSSNNFRNIATIISTRFSPIKLLKLIKEIEVKMGRSRDSDSIGHYTDRVIDIDIVLYNNILFESKKLEIPHKKNLSEREFSKKLLEEIGIKQQT